MATTGAVPVLTAVKLGILPVVGPAPNPIEIVLFVQVYTVPGGAVTDPVNTTIAVGAPLQTTWLAGWFTSGIGFTSTVAVVVAPVQVTPPLV